MLVPWQLMQFKKSAMVTQARQCHWRQLLTRSFNATSFMIHLILSGLVEIVSFSLVVTHH
jgi:hypothetical protein